MLASVPSSHVHRAADGRSAAWTFGGRALGDAERIPAERIDGPLLTISAGQDRVRPSSRFSKRVVSCRPPNGAPRVRLDYFAAGHAAGAGVPHLPAGTEEELPADIADFGGSPRADQEARADWWPKVLRFLDAQRRVSTG